jgi:WD40 repeat protein
MNLDLDLGLQTGTAMTRVSRTRRRCLKAGSAAALGVWTSGLMTACGGGTDDTKPDTKPDTKSDNSPAQRAAINTSTEPGAEVQTRKPLRSRARPYALKGITAIAPSRDRSLLAVSNAQGQVWTLNTAGKVLSRMNTAEPAAKAGTNTVGTNPVGTNAVGTSDDVSAATAGLVMSGNDKYWLAVNRNSTATAWRVDNSKKQFVLHGHEHGLRSVGASEDGAVIATGGEETRVMVWDGGSGKLKQILRGATDFVNSVSVSANGQYVASGDANGVVLIWQASTGKLLHSLRGHVGEVNAVTFDSAGQRLVSASEDGKVLLWDVVTGRGISALLGQRAEVRCVAFDSSSALLASGAVDGKVVVWNLAMGRVLLSVTPAAPAALPTAEVLPGAAPVLAPFTAPVAAVNVLAFSSTAEVLLFAGLDDGNVLPINLSTGGSKQ